MAREWRLVDDLDGGDADRTVVFSTDGIVYAIDLSDKNAGGLRKALDPYIQAGRRVGRIPGPIMKAAQDPQQGKAAPAPAPRPAAVDVDSVKGRADVRNWAAEQGMACPGRGRIPADVISQYVAAHQR